MSKIQVPGLFEETLQHGSTAKALKAADTAALNVKTAMVAVGDIHVIKDLNPRVKGTKAYKDHVEGIGKSIIANGFYKDKPLAVFVRKIDGEDKICLRDGHHRLAGVEWANKKQPGTVEYVPVVFDSEEMSDADMIVSFATGNMGKPLNPYELGVVVQRLAAEGLTKKEIASRLAITDRYIDDLGTLMQAPEDVIEMVLNDQVSSTLAIEMVKTHGEKAGKKLVKAAEKLEAIGKPGRVTSKHLPPEDRPKTKKSAGAKKAKSEPAPDEQPGEVFVRNPIYDAALQALEVLEAFRADYSASEQSILDEAMMAVVASFGDSDLIEYAVAAENYTKTGLVRLDLVTLGDSEAGDEAGEESEEAVEAAATVEAEVVPEPAPEPAKKRSRKSKAAAPSEEALAGL